MKKLYTILFHIKIVQKSPTMLCVEARGMVGSVNVNINEYIKLSRNYYTKIPGFLADTISLSHFIPSHHTLKFYKL